MACGYQGTSSGSFDWTSRSHGKAWVAVGAGRAAARRAVQQKFADRIDRDAAAEFPCNDSNCPNQQIVIKRFETTIEIGSSASHVHGKAYRWNGTCRWEADVYCLGANETLGAPAAGGGGGEGCGLVLSDDGPVAGDGQSGIDGATAQDTAKANARWNAADRHIDALNHSCPEGCPERHVMFRMDAEARADDATLDEARDLWNARARIGITLRVWCLPAGSRLRVVQVGTGGGGDKSGSKGSKGSGSGGKGGAGSFAPTQPREWYATTAPSLLRRSGPAAGTRRFAGVSITPLKTVLLHVRIGDQWVVDEHDIALILLELFAWLVGESGCIRMTNVRVTYPDLGITYDLSDINTCPEGGDCQEVARLGGGGSMTFDDNGQPVEVSFDEAILYRCR